jgi:hypothetical protein
MFEVARTCHDAIDLLTPAEEAGAVCDLISAFMRKVDFGRDLERQLEVLMECRQAFTNVDALKGAIVTASIDLAAKALRLVKGRHTAKTGPFVRAIFASAATSISAIDDPFLRMSLAQDAALAALHNGCVSQADLLYRAAIQEIPELPMAMAMAIALAPSADATAASLEGRLYALLGEYTRGIVPMPGHPEHGPFYLARGLLAAIQKFPWARGPASPLKCRSTILLLPLLHAYAADPLPVRVPGVDSNDVLFAGDPAYREELKALQRSVLEAVVGQLGAAATAVAGGDPTANGVLLQAVPDLLQPALLHAMLDLDAGVVPAIEAATLALKGAAPEHPLVKSTIALVTDRLARGAAPGKGKGGGPAGGAGARAAPLPVAAR